MPASIISYFVSSKDKHAIDLVLDFVTPMRQGIIRNVHLIITT